MGHEVEVSKLKGYWKIAVFKMNICPVFKSCVCSVNTLKHILMISNADLTKSNRILNTFTNSERNTGKRNLLKGQSKKND